MDLPSALSACVTLASVYLSTWTGSASHSSSVFWFCIAIAFTTALVMLISAKTTPRKQKIRESSDLIIGLIDELVFEVDKDWRLKYLSKRWEEWTDLDRQLVLGSLLFDIFVDAENRGVNAQQSVMESGNGPKEPHLVQVKAKSGSRLQIAIRVQPLFDDEGDFAGAIGIGAQCGGKLQPSIVLQESEARFRRMAEASPVGIFQADAQGKLTYMNSAWLERFGLEESVMLGDGWQTTLSGGEELLDDPAWEGFNQPGDVKRRVLRFKDGDGEDFWCEIVNSAEFDDQGNIVGFVGVAHDITQQRHAIEQLRVSEKRFQTLANMAPAGIFRTDSNGACTYVNESWKRQSGLTDGEWEGSRWSSALHPDDSERIGDKWKVSVEGELSDSDEFRWLRKDGSIVWSHVVFGPEYDKSGSMTGFIGVVSDITDRKHAEEQIAEREEQLAILADHATDAVLRIKLDGTCSYASPSARQVFHMDPARLVGERILARFHAEDAERVERVFQSLIAGRKERARVTFRFESLVERGVFHWLEASCGLVRDSDSGEPTEIIASLRNSDETKRLENALMEARDRAEAAAEAKSSFLANMSHEIRTPMNGVVGFTELALASELPTEQRQNLEMIADSGRAMLRLLNDLLDLAKIESGKMTVSSEATQTLHAIRGAMRIMEPVAAAKQLQLTLKVAKDVPEWIESDPMRLRQILLNLVGNALKFTDTGEVTVEVSMSVGGRTLEIAVEDTGIGMSQSELAGIFEKFTQADSSIARRFGGTGLGLPICRQLAELIGGTLEVKSEKGVGSRFTLKIPGSEIVAPVAEPRRANRKMPILALDAPQILIAEDSGINQKLAIGMLQKFGCSVEVASDGLEAVRLVQERQGTSEAFDLVLMDMQMPNLDGLEATRRIRSAGVRIEDLPIVAVTANAYQDDIDACIEAGMQAHLAKPLRLRDLESVLQRWCAKAEGAGEIAEEELDDPVLTAMFAERKSHALILIERLASVGKVEPSAASELASALHQIAGVAEYFGQAELGTSSRKLEKDLLGSEEHNPEMLEKVRTLLAA